MFSNIRSTIALLAIMGISFYAGSSYERLQHERKHKEKLDDLAKKLTKEWSDLLSKVSSNKDKLDDKFKQRISEVQGMVDAISRTEPSIEIIRREIIVTGAALEDLIKV